MKAGKSYAKKRSNIVKKKEINQSKLLLYLLKALLKINSTFLIYDRSIVQYLQIKIVYTRQEIKS